MPKFRLLSSLWIKELESSGRLYLNGPLTRENCKIKLITKIFPFSFVVLVNQVPYNFLRLSGVLIINKLLDSLFTV